MLTPDQYGQLLKWAREKESRSFTIECQHGSTKVWVFDQELMCGDLIDDPNQINLEEVAKKELEKQVARLKKISASLKGGNSE
mgnify:CR=1 FL=1